MLADLQDRGAPLRDHELPQRDDVHDPAVWEGIKRDQAPEALTPVLYGSDNDPRALDDARRNLAAAPIAGACRTADAPARSFTRPTLPAAAGAHGPGGGPSRGCG